MILKKAKTFRRLIEQSSASLADKEATPETDEETKLKARAYDIIIGVEK